MTEASSDKPIVRNTLDDDVWGDNDPVENQNLETPKTDDTEKSKLNDDIFANIDDYYERPRATAPAKPPKEQETKQSATPILTKNKKKKFKKNTQLATRRTNEDDDYDDYDDYDDSHDGLYDKYNL